MDSSEIVLRIPAQADLLHVVRAVVGAAGARLDLTYEHLDDLRLAVDEACTRLIVLAPGRPLEVRIDPQGRRLLIDVRVAAPLPEFPTDAEQQGLPWTVMHALVDEVEGGNAGDRSWIQLVKNIPPV